MKWVEKNKKEAIAILEERIKIHLYPELEIVLVDKIIPKTLFEATKSVKIQDLKIIQPMLKASSEEHLITSSSMI